MLTYQESNKIYKELDNLTYEEKINLILQNKCIIEPCHLDDSIGFVIEFIN